MVARILNITIEKGTTFSKDLTLYESNGVESNLTGHVAACSFMKHPSSTTKYNLVATVSNSIGGVITLSFANSNTSAITSGKFYYDVETTNTLSSANTVTRQYQGIVSFDSEIT